MESTPPTSKRVKTRAVRYGGRLVGWFFGDIELIERYRFETSTKVINNPKVVSFDWLKSEKLDNVRKLLKDQSLMEIKIKKRKKPKMKMLKRILAHHPFYLKGLQGANLNN